MPVTGIVMMEFVQAMVLICIDGTIATDVASTKAFCIDVSWVNRQVLVYAAIEISHNRARHSDVSC
jgi:hypothetical protein